MSSSVQASVATKDAPVEAASHGLRKGSVPNGVADASPAIVEPSNSPVNILAGGSGNQVLSASNTATGKRGSTKPLRKETPAKDIKDVKPRSGSGPALPVEPAIDPLSHLISVRTNSERPIPSRLRTNGRSDNPANESLARASSDLSTKQPLPPTDQGKDKKKTGSFLSRFSMMGNKKKDEDSDEDESEISELRTEGANAIVFSSAVECGGYIPHHKEPPRYIRVRAQSKKSKEFDRMFLAQELAGTLPPKDDSDTTAISGAPVQPVRGFGHKDMKTGGPIWAVEFSKDGRFMATAGRDHAVRVWATISTVEERATYEQECVGADAGQGERLSAPLFLTRPIREFMGHTGEILDLSWSKNNFLLSSSMDKTVRLWHMKRDECLCTFKHKDFVTSIAFHPRDDRFFLAGSLDSVLRLWSIPDKAVAYSSQIADLITAVAFSPDGKTCIAGCLNGLCTFYETEGLKFETQIHVRSSRGKNAKGSKITGIQTISFPPDDPEAEVKVLVTSNDSRIRIYSLRDKALEMKFKGHENTCNQIRASFSDDGNYVICGSEDKKAFIWSTGPSQSDNKDKRPCEYFEAHSAIVTQAVFAPTATRQLLQASQDPIFTLCNPPPVTLMSREEASISHTNLPHDGQSESARTVTKPEETPAFISRSKHHDGNIIVTTDHAGIIKVFRQDCAAVKRRLENWETGSTISRKLGKDGLLGRTGSIVTRTSVSSRDPHSRRGSITQPPGLGTPQLSSERIMSWRQGIEGTPTSRPGSIAMATSNRNERSVSPGKARTPVNSKSTNLASEARKQPYASSLASPPLQPTSPTSSIWTNDQDRLGVLDKPAQPPAPSFIYKSMDQDHENEHLKPDPTEGNYSFWNLNRWRGKGTALKGGSSSGPSSGSLEKKQSKTENGTPSVLVIRDSNDHERRKSGGLSSPQHDTESS